MLRRANDLGCESLSLPAIFSANFRHSRETYAKVLLKSISDFQDFLAVSIENDPEFEQSLRHIRLVDSDALMTQTLCDEIHSVKQSFEEEILATQHDFSFSVNNN